MVVVRSLLSEINALLSSSVVDGQLGFLFRKDTKAGVVLYFDNDHPMYRKHSYINGFLGRVNINCSSN